MADNKHNDPLEQFFRKKAGEYNIQYKEEDWLKLEERLDTLDQQNADQQWRHMAAAVVLVLFAVLAFITYEQQQKINQLNERLNNTEDITNIPYPIQSILPDESEKSTGDRTTQQQSPERNETQITTPNQPPVIASEQSSTTEELPAKSSDQTSVLEEIQPNISLVNITESNLAITSAKASPGGDGRYPAISAIEPPKFNAKTVLPGNSQQPTEASALRKPLAMHQTPRFTVGVLAGPDMSTVGGVSNFYDPGHKLGIHLEYHISRNFAVSIGALRSKVRYTARGNEYSPSQDYWTYNVTPDQTIGECILIDIPISLKYNFLHFAESRLYATAGASSYIMLDEEYRFNYNYEQPGLQQEWHERTGTRHWMSNATLSIGYELDIKQNLSIRAEPFIRLPLQEVGWGNVKLYSVGSFVSLNYNIY